MLCFSSTLYHVCPVDSEKNCEMISSTLIKKSKKQPTALGSENFASRPRSPLLSPVGLIRSNALSSKGERGEKGTEKGV